MVCAGSPAVVKNGTRSPFGITKYGIVLWDHSWASPYGITVQRYHDIIYIWYHRVGYPDRASRYVPWSRKGIIERYQRAVSQSMVLRQDHGTYRGRGRVSSNGINVRYRRVWYCVRVGYRGTGQNYLQTREPVGENHRSDTAIRILALFPLLLWPFWCKPRFSWIKSRGGRAPWWAGGLIINPGSVWRTQVGVGSALRAGVGGQVGAGSAKPSACEIL